MSIEPDVTRVAPPKYPVDDAYDSVDFEYEGERIKLQKYGDKYNCYWYTDEGLSSFVDAIEDLRNISDINLTRASIDGKDIYGEKGRRPSTKTYEEMRSKSLDNISYLEVNINGVDIYWAEEDPDSSLPYVVEVMSSELDPEPLRPLYLETAPSTVTDKDTLIDSVIKYLSGG